MLYYLIIFSRIYFYKEEKKEVLSQEPVSIIICAKNEAENLERFLPSVLEQKYPEYEVVVVNDCSTDNTQEILNGLKEKYPHLYVTTIKPDNKFRHGKKMAVTIGIKAAKNNSVTIELNASPLRLDINWRHLKFAREQGVIISINPDAHRTENLYDTFLGVGIARKGWLEKKDLLNSWPVEKVKKYLADS